MSTPCEPNTEQPAVCTKKDTDTVSFDNLMAMPSIEEERSDRKITQQHFDWKKGSFRTDGLPLWVKMSLQALLAVLLSVAPPIIGYMKLIPGAYPLISLEPPVNPSVLMETLRAAWLLGIPSLVYVGIQFWICFIPWFTFKMARLRALLVEDVVRQSLEQTWSIRGYFGLTGAGIALALFARVLYPMPSITVPLPLVDPAAVSNAAKAGASAAAAATKANELIALGSNLQFYFNRPYQFFINSSALAMAIISVVFLVEKLLLKAISHRYHMHSLEGRIKTNQFARKVTQGLKQHALAVLGGMYSKAQSGPLILDLIGKDQIKRDDLAEFMDKDTACRYFTILDPDRHGSLDHHHFLKAIDAVYEERNEIDRTFLDQQNILGKFDQLMMVIVWLLSFIVMMVVMDPPIKFLVTFAVTLIGGTMFMIRDTAKKAFDSVVFVVFTHPFDMGDWIVLKEEMYQVHEVGLWTSTFLTSNGKLVYIANRNLVNLPITNLRRSPFMDEAIPFSVLPSTDPDKIKALEAKLLEWVRHHERDYMPSLVIRGFKLVDKEHLKLEVSLKHRANFNDQHRKDLRTRKFVMKLKDYIHELGIELSPPMRA